MYQRQVFCVAAVVISFRQEVAPLTFHDGIAALDARGPSTAAGKTPVGAGVGGRFGLLTVEDLKERCWHLWGLSVGTERG